MQLLNVRNSSGCPQLIIILLLELNSNVILRSVKRFKNAPDDVFKMGRKKIFVCRFSPSVILKVPDKCSDPFSVTCYITLTLIHANTHTTLLSTPRHFMLSLTITMDANPHIMNTNTQLMSETSREERGDGSWGQFL